MLPFHRKLLFGILSLTLWIPLTGMRDPTVIPSLAPSQLPQSSVPAQSAKLSIPAQPAKKSASTQPAKAFASTQFADTDVLIHPVKRISDGSWDGGNNFEKGTNYGSNWLAESDTLMWDGHQLVRVHVPTGLVTPLADTSHVFSNQHWVSVVSLSPNGRWIVWASGTDAAPTWTALSTDGIEHRQWPREASITEPNIAWMQDNTHWVVLSASENSTQVNSKQWLSHEDNMHATVYSLETEDVQQFPLRLEKPDPTFMLVGLNNLLFTEDGRAWLSTGVFTGVNSNLNQEPGNPPFPLDKAASWINFYELVPGQEAWLLRRMTITLNNPYEDGLYSGCVRSPDDQWLLWRRCAWNGKAWNEGGPMQLMLSRTDGSDMRPIYETQGLDFPQWLPNSQGLAFRKGSDIGFYQIALDRVQSKMPYSQHRLPMRLLAKGLFPTERNADWPARQARIADRR